MLKFSHRLDGNYRIMLLTASETYYKYAGYLHSKKRQVPVDPELAAIELPAPGTSKAECNNFYETNADVATALSKWIKKNQEKIDEYYKLKAQGLFKQYQQYSEYLYTHVTSTNPEVRLPSKGSSYEEFSQFYNSQDSFQDIENLENWINNSTIQYRPVLGKKSHLYLENDGLYYETFNGKKVPLDDPKYNEIKRKISTPGSYLNDADQQLILDEIKQNKGIPSNAAYSDYVILGRPDAQRLYVYLENNQLFYRTPGIDGKEVALNGPQYESIKHRISRKERLSDENLSLVLYTASDNGDIQHRIIHRYFEQRDKNAGAAAIAYTFYKYLQAYPPQGVKLPPAFSSYEECKTFFNNPENSASANNLVNGFKKNRLAIHKYYQSDVQLLQEKEERWIEFSTTDAQTRLTTEYLKQNYIVDFTRLLNGLDSLQEALFPYEAVQILDEFMPVLKETGNMEEAEAHIAKRMTVFLAKKFANVLTLVDTCDEEVLTRLFPDFSVNTAREILKKQLCFVIFLQPLFNYQFASDIDEETKLGRIAAYRVMSEIIGPSLDAQIEGAAATVARANTFSKDRPSEAKTLIERTDKSLAEGTISSEPRRFKESLHEIYKDPKKFKATKGGNAEALFLDRGLKYKDYVMPSKAGCIAYIQLSNPQTRQIFQNNHIAFPSKLVRSSKDYRVEIISNPHTMSESKIKDKVIYVSENGDYVVRALDGKVKREGFDIAQMPRVDASKSPEFLQYMLTVTSASGYTTQGEEQQLIDFYAAPKNQESAQKIFQWNQDRARYCASIAYIYKDYVNNPSNKRHWLWNRSGLPDSIELPQANASYQDCINFYSHPARSASADALSTWFNANSAKVKKWYAPSLWESLFGMSNKREYKSKLGEAQSFQLPIKLHSINDPRYDSTSILNPKPPFSVFSYLYSFIVTSAPKEIATEGETEPLLRAEARTNSPRKRSDSDIFLESTVGDVEDSGIVARESSHDDTTKRLSSTAVITSTTSSHGQPLQQGTTMNPLLHRLEQRVAQGEAHSNSGILEKGAIHDGQRTPSPGGATTETTEEDYSHDGEEERPLLSSGGSSTASLDSSTSENYGITRTRSSSSSISAGSIFQLEGHETPRNAAVNDSGEHHSLLDFPH